VLTVPQQGRSTDRCTNAILGPTRSHKWIDSL